MLFLSGWDSWSKQTPITGFRLVLRNLGSAEPRAPDPGAGGRDRLREARRRRQVCAAGLSRASKLKKIDQNKWKRATECKQTLKGEYFLKNVLLISSQRYCIMKKRTVKITKINSEKKILEIKTMIEEIKLKKFVKV